jgi:hypothetical protein
MSDDDMLNYDNSTHPLVFLGKVSFAVIGGLILGSIIDTSCRKIQNDDIIVWKQRNIGKALLFFLIQVLVNIIVLLILCSIYPNKFIKWFQLSISGALFAVLFFSVQRNLLDNSLRISHF